MLGQSALTGRIFSGAFKNDLARKLLCGFVLSGLTLAANHAEAARITRVKDNQVMVDLEGSSDYSEGSRYMVIVGGKRKAVIELSKIKNGKAIGKVLKGKPAQDGTLTPLGGGSGSSSKTASKSRRSRSRESSSDSFSDLTVGAVLGFASDSQSVTGIDNDTQQKVTTDMSGSGFSLKAFADLPISGNLGAIGRVGLEKFSVKGSFPNGAPAATDITYLSADLLVRYNFLDGAFKIFPLGGLGIHYPISKTSGPLNVQQISATTIFFLGGGMHYKFSDSMYAVATAEYGLFPPSNDVKTSLIAVRGGVGWLL
ncbi:MAG: hypothetical protein EOP05_16025 [Proteobacteria bacterium]|nr:MAG: hypothetical protein EOP05_16025 [Pseudomonadota bacterium]